MTFQAGTRIGAFEITAALGSGGMGDVYKARDTRLGRTVALKVMRETLSVNPLRRERFAREARAISQLNHPHICTLFDFGETPPPPRHSEDAASDGGSTIQFLVMEFIDGETLKTRLEEGPLPLGDAITCAIQIADALETAHRSGIVHRDLKPGNVMLSRSGAKLLDFGIARVLATDRGPIQSRQDTGKMSDRLTMDRFAVGTFPYVAPEQLTGLEADARSDLFTLGQLIYEMVTGRPAFGEGHASVVAAVLEATPLPMSALRSGIPPLLELVVDRCLSKEPKNRWSSAHDVTLVLRAVQASLSTPTAAVPQSRSPWRVAGMLATALVALVSLGVWLSRPGAALAEAPLSFVIPAAPGAEFSDLAIAPDGRNVAYVSEGALWIRSFGTAAPRRLAGTDGAYAPFWSPDSNAVAYFSGIDLRLVPAAGGPSRVVCEARRAYGGTWSARGTILFVARAGTALMRVSADGGEPVQIRTPERGTGQYALRGPRFLPDGDQYLFSAYSNNAESQGVFAASLESGVARRLVDVASNAVYASEHLLFARSGSLYAQPFDPATLTLSGEPMSIVTRVERSNFEAAPYYQFDASGGTLLYRGGPTFNRQLTWIDRDGRTLDALTEPGDFRDFAISPDGGRVAVDQIARETGLHQIWLFDVARNTRVRVTPETADYARPVWAPDASRLAYASNHRGRMGLYVRPVDPGGQEELLVDGIARPSAWSADGARIAFELFTQDDGFDLLMASWPAGRQPETFLKTPSMEREPQISPNGRWMAYSSSAAGSRQVYVDTIPASGRPWRVSGEHGREPRWSTDGKELFYLASDYWLTAVSVESRDGVFHAGTPQPLFKVVVTGADLRYHYDVAPGGDRFLVNALLDGGTTPLTVVTRWNQTIR